MTRVAGAVAMLGCIAALACRPARGVQPPATHAPAATDSASAASGTEPSSSERDAALRELGRIGVIGASLSAGFGDGVPLHRMLDAALAAPHAIVDASSSGLFLRATDIAEIEIGVMKLRGARLVVAVDFLFWFAYGDKPDAQRLADLEIGLGLLETLEVPVLVGDLPDVHGASPKMISPRQIPDRTLLDALNARIRDWARSRPSMHVIPMAAWTDALRAGMPPAIDGVTIPSGDPLLQWDGLHPTARGQAVLAVLVLARLRASRPALRAGDLVDDPDAVLARFRDAQGWDRLPKPPKTSEAVDAGAFAPGERSSDAM